MMPLNAKKNNPDQWGFRIINKPIESNLQGTQFKRISKTRGGTRQFIGGNLFK